MILIVVEDDLKEVKEAVIKLAAKARSLGLALGISVSELDTIRSKFSTDPEEMLTEVLYTWLKQAYDVKKHGLPSWRILVQSIENSAGGKDPALAMEIAAQHPGMCIYYYYAGIVFSWLRPLVSQTKPPETTITEWFGPQSSLHLQPHIPPPLLPPRQSTPIIIESSIPLFCFL